MKCESKKKTFLLELHICGNIFNIFTYPGYQARFTLNEGLTLVTGVIFTLEIGKSMIDSLAIKIITMTEFCYFVIPVSLMLFVLNFGFEKQ